VTLRQPRRSSVKSSVSQQKADSFKNFYGNWQAKFPKTCAKEKSGFRGVVAVTLWSGSLTVHAQFF
jgi:hypothetical protein